MGKVAGWIPIFKIGGTISKEKVVISKIVEIKIIINEEDHYYLSKIGSSGGIIEYKAKGC